MKKTTLNQVWLGDEIGKLANEMTSDGFNPEAVILIGLMGDTVRVKGNCRNLFETAGALITACEYIRVKG